MPRSATLGLLMVLACPIATLGAGETRSIRDMALLVAAWSYSHEVTAEAGLNTLNEFRCLLAGHWDNQRQAAADIALGATGLAAHPRRAMTYVPILNQQIEGQLFAILNYTELGFDGPISRVSLHRFRAVGEDQLIHEFLFLRGPGRWGDLSEDLSPLMQLDETDARINAKCAMRWDKQDDHFVGKTTKGQCVTSSFTPEPILVEGHGELWADRLIRHDQNFSLSGDPLPTPGGGSPERFDKVVRNDFQPPGLAKASAGQLRCGK